MILEATPWLPAAPDGEIEGQLAKMAADWLAPWINDTPSIAVERADQRSLPGLRWLGCSAAAIGFGQEAPILIGQASVAARADPANSGDKEILANIGDQVLADVARGLCEIVHPNGTRAELTNRHPDGQMTAYHIRDRSWSILVSITAIAECRLRLRNVSRRKPPVLGKLSEALAPENVRIGCHMGAASISAADLKTLTRGDVIVLDTLVSQELPLAVEDVRTPGGRAVIESSTGAHLVRIVQPLELPAESV